jgi:Icc-related predicted phosphoesterase
MTIRIAAVGDIHLGTGSQGTLRPMLASLQDCADVLLLAGDLTRHGTIDEALVVADELTDVPVPVVAVLGNHDYHGDRPQEIAALLAQRGVHVLEGSSVVLEVGGRRLGVAGAKGFGGGFAGRALEAFGEPELKVFAHKSAASAHGLRSALHQVATAGCDVRIALTHYSPVPDTLAGEPLEIYPFLGSYLLAQAIDEIGADLAVHGHAHSGSEQGMTNGGVRVRNVAQPLIRRSFVLFHLNGEQQDSNGRGEHAPESQPEQQEAVYQASV